MVAYVKLQETVQILQPANSPKFKRLPNLRQSEPAGDQMPKMPRANSAQLGEMQHLRTLPIDQLSQVWEAHLLRRLLPELRRPTDCRMQEVPHNSATHKLQVHQMRKATLEQHTKQHWTFRKIMQSERMLCWNGSYHIAGCSSKGCSVYRGWLC